MTTSCHRIEGVESHLIDLQARICAAVGRADTRRVLTLDQRETIADAVLEELGVEYVEGQPGAWRYVTSWQSRA